MNVLVDFSIFEVFQYVHICLGWLRASKSILDFEHDVEVADHCHISTGALINGGASLGKGSFVGSGAILREGLVIPPGSVISAGKRVMGWPLS